MFPSLPSNLDNLASAGIVDFDPEAFIKGADPRYTGAPQKYLPFEIPYPGGVQPQRGGSASNSEFLSNVSMHQQAKKDEFVVPGKENNKKPVWKKVLVGAAALALLIFGGMKLKKPISKLFSKSKSAVNTATQTATKTANPKATKFLDKVKSFFGKIGNGIKTGWNKFIGLFKSKS
jgi:hypothetical protein